MEEVVVRVEVSAIIVGWLLCVPELVVHAELEHQSIKGGRSDSIANAKSHLQQEEKKTLQASRSRICARQRRESHEDSDAACGRVRTPLGGEPFCAGGRKAQASAPSVWRRCTQVFQ